MHYYIYPKGMIGQTFGKMLDYCKVFSEFKDCTYSFIDDFKENLSLKEQAKEIKQRVEKKEAKVVIALSQAIRETKGRLEAMRSNLANEGILEHLEAPFVEYVSKLVCQRAKEEISKIASGGGA